MRTLRTRRPANVGVRCTALLACCAPAALALEPAAAERSAQKRAAPRFEPFVGSLDDAKRSAAERNVPLLLHVVLEGEPQNDEYRDNVLPDSELVALSELAVVIVSNNGEHETKSVKEEIEGKSVERQVCSAYPWFERCEQHRECWDPIYLEFHDPDGAMRCPQTILLDPAGAVAWRHNEGNPAPASEIASELKKAQKAAGKGLGASELGEVKRHLAQGRLAASDSAWPRAWRAWSAALALMPSGPFGAEAKAGADQAASELRKALDVEIARLVPGSAGPAYRKLCELAVSLADTPLAKDAQAALRDAEKNKAIASEIDAAKLEMEAEALWAEAQALVAAGDERKAERVVRRLLRKRYADTAVGKLAREKHPDWAGEEDAKGK